MRKNKQTFKSCDSHGQCVGSQLCKPTKKKGYSFVQQRAKCFLQLLSSTPAKNIVFCEKSKQRIARTRTGHREIQSVDPFPGFVVMRKLELDILTDVSRFCYELKHNQHCSPASKTAAASQFREPSTHRSSWPAYYRTNRTAAPHWQNAQLHSKTLQLHL